MMAPGPSRCPERAVAVASYGTGTTATRERAKSLYSGGSQPKFRGG